MSVRTTLALKADVTTLLYRAIVTRLTADPVLSACVKTWQTWEGGTGDLVDITNALCPALRITPQPLSEQWFSPETQSGTMAVLIEAWAAGTCVDDMLNLWGAIRRAVYNPTDRESWMSFNRSLQSKGSHTGLVLMQTPLQIQPLIEQKMLVANGQITLDYRAPVASG